ncbi:hypothetical protein B0O99DRAFT_681779 [Bisporella sp. PMI_857]|nr:hypothetical protein B0O99DRAFT_681779 [Bisporella sp. PMI_857]
MAANKTLDPTTCTTASEAFRYPLPQVRQFHRGLTAQLDEKNARLRTLVGGSYRQLLGTAEMILQMREDIADVEEKLGRVGKGCGRTVISGKAGGLASLHGKLREGNKEKEMGWVVKMEVLEMCAVVIGGLLRKARTPSEKRQDRGANLVVAAKVLVLSRLLAKSLSDTASDQNEKDLDTLEDSRKKLGVLRRKLLRAIERTLEHIGENDHREDMIQAMCSYSLATSSGAKDVLRHFLHVRGEAMALTFENSPELRRESTDVLKALKLYTRTLLDVQALTPRRLRDALESLKKKPLLKDEGLRNQEGLRLDVSEKWFGDQIRYFTPYNRHDDLDGPLALETLKGWAKKASEVLLQGFNKTLMAILDFKTVVELRTNIFEVWIKDGGKAKGFDPSVMLDGFRKVINDRLVRLLESRVNKLHLIGVEIEGTLDTWRDGVTDHHARIWGEDMLESDISNGASHFKEDLIARAHGRNDAVSKAVNGYQSWRRLIDETITVLEDLRKQRWDDDLEDIEDDLNIESRGDLLSKDDPQLLQNRLNSSLEIAYSDLDQKITTLLENHRDSERIGPMAAYSLRLLRDIRSSLPKNEAIQKFGLSLVPSLHKTLASKVLESAIQKLGSPFSRTKVAGRALWEGSPELPVQPTPRIFKFLHNLTTAMAEVGGDIWSPAAVSSLKQYTITQLSSTLKAALKQLEANASAVGSENGNTGDGGAESVPELKDTETSSNEAGAADSKSKRDVYIQALFDVFVLQNSLEGVRDTDNELQSIQKSIESHIELDTALQRRLQNSAKEYWKKTSLLFSLLA